ncbi:MAG: energy-coupling factor transporter transmembrane protein EcfT [Synergistaceae bacterium]|nr:energy-coupling factor transporter transmembrane protein EcfT [Synergistaceae bacterium]
MRKINPAVKAITILIAAILISFQYITALNIAIFSLCLILIFMFSDVKLKTFLKILIPALIAAFGIFLLGLYYAKGSGDVENLSAITNAPYAVRAAMSRNFQTALSLATRLLAYAGLGILFALTTDGEEFITSLVHQCNLSPKFAYGIIAAVNIMPHMLNELENVRLSYKVRGIKAGYFSPKVLFTMLVNSVRWSESLALAMESKGFSQAGGRSRTYYSVTKIHYYDFIFSLVLLGLIITGMIFLS